jgi:hypothetical protein
MNFRIKILNREDFKNNIIIRNVAQLILCLFYLFNRRKIAGTNKLSASICLITIGVQFFNILSIVTNREDKLQIIRRSTHWLEMIWVSLQKYAVGLKL